MNRFKSKLLAVACAMAMLFLPMANSGCISANPATGKKELMFIGTAQEVSLGKSVAESVEKQYRVDTNPMLNQRVMNIFNRLAKTADRQDLKYSIKVLDTKMVNAFACPGGFLYVTKGLLEFSTSDDELACIIGHEFGHVVARHSVKAMQRQIGYSVLIEILASGTKDEKKKNTLRAVASTGLGLILLGYGRKNEYQSDYLGMRYAQRAGYNPNGAISFFQKLQKLEKGKPTFLSKILSTHPPTADRIKECQAHLNAKDLESPKK